MRVAALYDIHGNLRALEAALADVERAAPDVILIGGDIALGPVPRETLDRLLALGERATFIRGNCDREMSAPPGTPPTTNWGARTQWATGRCSRSQLRFLAGLPTTATLDVSGLGATLFCHGSPRRDDEILTRLTSDDRLRTATTGFAHAAVVSGHTHVQYDRRALGRRWLNPGSVGMAYEEQPGAYWALLGPDVELRCTPYDVERAIEDVRSSGFPDAEEFVEKYLVRRPDPTEASAFFEKMAEGAPAS